MGNPTLSFVSIDFPRVAVDRTPMAFDIDQDQVSADASFSREERSDFSFAAKKHLYVDCVLPLGTLPYDMSAYVTSPSGQLENCEIM